MPIFGDNVIHEYYGTTETGLNVIAEPEDIRAHPKSSGLPMEGSKIAIIDETGLRLSPEGVGRGAINSYQNMDGYVGKEAETRVLDGETYLLTPDYGYLDEEGRLFLHGRSDGGAAASWTNIYELEDEIRGHPAIRDAYVFAEKRSS